MGPERCCSSAAAHARRARPEDRPHPEYGTRAGRHPRRQTNPGANPRFRSTGLRRSRPRARSSRAPSSRCRLWSSTHGVSPRRRLSTPASLPAALGQGQHPSHSLRLLGPSVEVDDVEGVTLLGVNPPVLPRLVGCKRGIDLVAAATLLILRAPLSLVPMALTIRLDSPRPRPLPPASGSGAAASVPAVQVPDDGRRRRGAARAS